VTNFKPNDLTERLLFWFDEHRRALPWRDAPCGQRDPYRVWLAEIMLQQTTVTAVIPYYENFLRKWPNAKALAAATDDEVMRSWAGLGYYARARNMLKCARTIANYFQGCFPKAEQDLLKLPGIGPYTAAAVSAIVGNGPTAPVDGNVIRTISRLYAVEAEMPKNKNQIQILAQALCPQGQSGDFAEALMDLGSQVCRPKNPKCPECPWHLDCNAFQSGLALNYPKKALKKEKPTRRGWAFWIVRPDGSVFLEQRPPKGLLGGMMGLPTTHWDTQPPTAIEAMKALGFENGHSLPGFIKHTFTHFHLELRVIHVKANGTDELSGIWALPQSLTEQALPSVMKKVIVHAQKG